MSVMEFIEALHGIGYRRTIYEARQQINTVDTHVHLSNGEEMRLPSTYIKEYAPDVDKENEARRSSDPTTFVREEIVTIEPLTNPGGSGRIKEFSVSYVRRGFKISSETETDW